MVMPYKLKRLLQFCLFNMGGLELQWLSGQEGSLCRCEGLSSIPEAHSGRRELTPFTSTHVSWHMTPPIIMNKTLDFHEYSLACYFYTLLHQCKPLLN